MSGPENLRQTDAVIFDMDGVLADTEPLHCKAWVLILRDFGFELSEKWFERWIGVRDTEAARQIVDQFSLGISPDDLIDQKQIYYYTLVKEQLQPFAGLRQRLELLSSLPLAVATSSSRIASGRILDQMGLTSLFPVVVTCQDVARTKPDPEVYLLAASRLGVTPSVCAAIEDSPAGTESALAAGCLVLGVTTTQTADRLAAAHKVFETTVGAVDWILSR